MKCFPHAYLYCLLSLLLVVGAFGQTMELNESAAKPDEWGYRPADGQTSPVNPPGFTWRPQRDIVSWELQCAKDAEFARVAYSAEGIDLNVHCPPRDFPPGEYHWRYRGKTAKGEATKWSKARRFTLTESAAVMPMPAREELLSRIPEAHPRLFVRPEDRDNLRGLSEGELRPQYDHLVRQCEKLLADPPDTTEPPTYPEGTVSHSEQWRVIWWGNREKVQEILGGSATLAFVYWLGGEEKYGQLARRILMDAAAWDPKGATGYRYNDEAGMPYNYYFARTYTFVHPLLSEEERQKCRAVMRIRGEEMYRHLHPRHLWSPYSSHSNRAWHFLGEVGIAFHGEIPEADEWSWFALNVFFNCYPVWSDDDGGWHEGLSYWKSYIYRFTWWADVMRAAFGIDAFDKPYFSQIGFYPMYVLPPGKKGGGFGDLTASQEPRGVALLMTELAAQAQNPYWQWYVEEIGGPESSRDWIGFVRGALPSVEPKKPDGLPTSRIFRGTGQAFLNTTITEPEELVQVAFKSSPFGLVSHGYEANNSFLLFGYGERLLVRSGYRDIYGSAHHKDWMWSTRSVNNITINGQSQYTHSYRAQGRITAFKTTPEVDIVVGETRQSSPSMDRFIRAIVFVKPDLVIVYDQVSATEEASYDYWLHAVNRFDVKDQENIDLKVNEAGCQIAILEPKGLQFRQTDQYDPNPRERITLREWHLTATPPGKSKSVDFVAVYRPYRVREAAPHPATLEQTEAAYVVTAERKGEPVRVTLPRGQDRVDEAGITVELGPPGR